MESHLLDENNDTRGMFDVSIKPDTYRVAKAQAILKIDPNTNILINEGKSPKGDVVEAAKISATLGAKRTSDLIPYCHPIPIDQVRVEVSIKPEHIEVVVEVKSVWKTGVEIEALTGACIGVLTIYDMLKPIDNSLSITSVKLLQKSGGMKDLEIKEKINIKAVVIVVSDSVADGRRKDRSGNVIVDILRKKGIDVVGYEKLSDDVNLIEDNLKKYCDEPQVDLILTTGGTGLGPRDVTPEATMRVIDREVSGISEASRAYGQRRTPLAMFSRGLAGVRKKTLIINLPGSTRAVSEYMDFLFPSIKHAFKMMEGQGH
jgi:cyclic pyranopterin monophosphate synthase